MKKIFALLLICIGLISCLKDENISNQKYGLINTNTKKIILFTKRLGSIALPLKNVDTTINAAELRLSSEEPIDEDVLVSLSIDKSQEIIDNYNSEHETKLVPFPTSLYSLISGYNVSIPKGSKVGNLKLTVNTSAFDLEEAYAMGLYIKSVDKNSLVISGNLDTIVVKIAAKNKYDGVYSVSGSSLRAGDDVLSGPIKDKVTRDVITTGPNSLTYNPPWADGSDIGGIGGTTITLDPATNKVTMSSSNPALVNLPSYDNRYDPATRTFYLSFYWGNGPSHRAATHKLVFKNDRQ